MNLISVHKSPSSLIFILLIKHVANSKVCIKKKEKKQKQQQQKIMYNKKKKEKR